MNMEIIRHNFVVDSYKDGKFACIKTETISKDFIVNQNNKNIESFIKNIDSMYDSYEVSYNHYDYKNKLTISNTRRKEI